MNNNETHIIFLRSIQKIVQQLLEATEAEMELFSSSLSYSYTDTLLRTIMRLEREMFLCMDYLDLSNSSFWISAAEQSDQLDTIAIWVEPFQVTIRLPYLPHRYKGNQDAMAQLLAAKIHLCTSFPHWYNWHADFIHLCPAGKKSIRRDVDNYSYKKIVDVIAFGLRTSDDAAHFDMAMTSVFSDDYEPGVYIQIRPTTIEDRPLPSPVARKDSYAPQRI